MSRLHNVSYHDDCGVVDTLYQEAECPNLPKWAEDGSTRIDAAEEQWDREEYQRLEDLIDDYKTID